MTQVVSVKEIKDNIAQMTNKVVKIRGWIKTIRKQKDYIFINLFDGTCFQNIQLIVLEDKVANFDEISKLNTGTALEVEGKLVPAYKGDGLELELNSLSVEGVCPPEYPLQPKKHSMEFLRSIAHLRPRTNLFQAIFRVRSEAAFALHEFFHSNNFVYIHTPIITDSDAEGAGEMFNVTTLDLLNVPLTEEKNADYAKDFFGKKASLTVSGQLNAECYAQAFQNVYTFGPTFRAEQSNTSRHAAEFWMLEPEIAFCDLDKDMDIAEAMLKFSIKRILERCADEIDFFNKFVDSNLKERLNFVVDSPFARVSYTECIDILINSQKKFDYPVYWGCDLQTEHERYLTEEHFKQPIFVINYPKEIKAFYMRQNEDGKTVAAMDCLVPGVGELIGGSQREERYDRLMARIEELGMNFSDYQWYLDLRKYGSTKHAGFGLGFERFIMYLTGVNNIRDVIPFPRTTGSIQF